MNNLFENKIPFDNDLYNKKKIVYNLKMNKTFNNSFYKTKNKNPFRQFYHITEIFNNFRFAKFLFKVDSCKSNKQICLPYYDIRYSI